MEQKFEFANQNDVPFDIETGEPLLGRYTNDVGTPSRPRSNYELASATLEYEAGWATATLASSYQEFSQSAVVDLTRFFGPHRGRHAWACPPARTRQCCSTRTSRPSAGRTSSG